MRGGLALSFVVGLLSSILGIGGGIIHVPAIPRMEERPLIVRVLSLALVIVGLQLLYVAFAG